MVGNSCARSRLRIHLRYQLYNRHTPRSIGTAVVLCDPTLSKMDDFIERTLKERRTPQEALADLLAKYYRIPPNNERRALERMIEDLKAEIALRKTAAGT